MDGSIWVGSVTNLVDKFDGSVWESYNVSNSNLPHNSTRTILNDSNGNTWIGTLVGDIVKFDGSVWTQVYETTSAIHFIYEDSQNNVWFLNGGKVIQFDGSSWIVHNNIPASIAITEDIYGNLWFCSNQGVVKYNGSIWETYNTENSNIPTNQITSIDADGSGNIWMATPVGLVKYDGNVWLVYNTNNSSLEGDVINKIFIDDTDIVWLAYSISGIIKLIKFDGSGWDPLEDFNDYSAIKSLYVSADGTVWLGSIKGLAQYRGDKWETHNFLNSGLSHNSIESISEDLLGNIWVATLLGGVCKINRSINPYFHSQTTCSGNTTYLKNLSYIPTQSEWRIDGQTVSYEKDLEYVFEQSGDYEVSLIVSNEDGCTDFYQKMIYIPNNANELATHLPDYVSICEGAPFVTIEPSVYGLDSYEWTDNTGATLPGLGPGLYPTVESTGTYYFTVTDVCGQTASDSVIVILGEDCVWSGDTDKDGVVKHWDLLPIGLAFEASGTDRLGATLDWRGQASYEWGVTLGQDSIDYKHMDTDGNGIINPDDPVAIHQNYNKERDGITEKQLPRYSIAPYSLVPIFESLDIENSKLQFSLELVSNDEVDIPFYGIAASILYETPTEFDSLNANLTLLPEAVGEDAISIIQQYSRKTELAIVGTNHQNRSFYYGLGGTASNKQTLGSFSIGETKQVSGGDSILYMKIIPDLILMVNSVGDTIPVKGEELDIFLPDSTLTFVVTTQPIYCDSIGDATIVPIDPTASYSYLWSNGDTTQTIISPAVGTYSMIVTDNETGSQYFGTVNIQGTNPIELTVYEENNRPTANAKGGDGNYLYFWSNGENSPSANDLDITNYEVTVMDGNGCIATASNITLPVELFYFSGQISDGKSYLTWETVSERNSDYFIMEYSMNGIHTEGIGKVTASGNSSETVPYHFIHPNPALGMNYYRLKIVDKDGRYEYSDWVALEYSDEKISRIFSLYPNPVHSGQLFLEYSTQAESSIFISISTMEGKQIFQDNFDIYSGTNQIDIDVHTLSEGVYNLCLEGDGGMENQRFTIIKD